MYLTLPFSAHPQALRIAFWNTENLFVPQDDSLTNDDEFTPDGTMRWTYKRYQAKLNGLCKTIVALDAPLIIGLAEVENSQAMHDLCQGTALRRLGYKYVHHDTPDLRGIDNAMLYDSRNYRLLSSRLISMDSSHVLQHRRNHLLTIGVTKNGDTLVTIICHFPSKLGGRDAAQARNLMASQLRDTLDELRQLHPKAIIVAMGDFNAEPHEESMTKSFGLPCDKWKNLMADMPEGDGSYNYKGAWSYFDQIIVSTDGQTKYAAQVFRPDFLLTDDVKILGQKPKRTYTGFRYQGGLSDHLPVYVDIFTTH